MNHRIQVVLVIISIFFVSSLVLAYRLLPSARLVTKSNYHDFGAVTANQDLEHSFRLSRSGFGSLKIVQVTSSCGCLDAKLREEIGGWVLDFKMRAEQDLGRKQVSVWIQTDEILNNLHQFDIRCEVVSPVSISPQRPDFGQIEVDGASAARLVVDISASKGLGSPEVKIIDRVQPPVFHLNGPTSGTRYTLGFASLAPVGPLTASLRVSFPEGRSAPVEFPIRGMVVGDYCASPAEIETTWENLNQPFVAGTRLITEGPARSLRFAIDRVYSDLENSKNLEVAFTRSSTENWMEIRLKPGPRWVPGGTCRGVVRLRAGDRAIIHVPVNIHLGV